MQPIQYIKVTSNGLLKYRRRTPSELQKYIPSQEIIKSLGRNKTEANKKAIELSQALDEAIQLSLLPSIPPTVIHSLLTKHNLTSIQIDSKIPKNSDSITWSQAVDLYLKQSQVTPMEFSNRQSFFLKLMPSIFNTILKIGNPELTKLTYTVQLEIRNLLLKLPKKNIHRYRAMELSKLISDVHHRELTIDKNDLMALDTINKQLKRIKSLLIFCQNTGQYQGIIPNMTLENKTQTRGQRKEFSADELQTLDDLLHNDPIYHIVQILRYTGMRSSELLKCSLSEIEGILCFDLRTPKEPLKTLSSHRIIPVSNKVKKHLEGFQEFIQKHCDKYVTERFSKILKRHLTDPKNKSLYSLRHTFATNLIANGIQPEIVSELMGHSHHSMTLNRYVKGYPIATLKSAIDTL